MNHGRGMCRKHYREHFKEQDTQANKKWRAKNSKWIKEYYHANKEKIKIRDSHPEVKFRDLKNRAKREKTKFTLDYVSYLFLSKLPCFYCHGPLPVFGCGIDRKDSDKGYTKENSLPCCSNCNYLKRENLSVRETKAAIQAIYKVRGSEWGKLWEK